jgi:hypothetical protein
MSRMMGDVILNTGEAGVKDLTMAEASMQWRGNLSAHASGWFFSAASELDAVVRSLGRLRRPQDDIALAVSSG